MRKRRNGKVKKEYYHASYRDIFWEENDKMRAAVDRLWNMISDEDKEKLKKILQKENNVV